MCYDQQIYSTQPKEPNFIIHKTERNFETDHSQQKQRNQLISIDNKNILTYSFQQRHHIQPNFMTVNVRFLIYTIHNGGNAKLETFSFIPLRQRI